ncbi:hypothetical protein ACN50C_08840 [Levilactobacillus brevis]|nr:hypothetical protein [Levilactobacillus brevis]MBL3537948.1 hypothetical protein [Lactobacillus sp. GPR40-2]MBU7539981.1 hypothetical protein [Levilactobacillus brevis]MBU7559192.1 hypothetical protein [Levilactobacillus brevis]MBU7566090.1 hypothetical protein [Levilactobacillus brevis]MCB5233252.1 hypothetical protein [Levilactobacillus brevis]
MVTFGTSHLNATVMAWHTNPLLTLSTMKEAVMPMLRHLVAEAAEWPCDRKPDPFEGSIKTYLTVDLAGK